MALAAWAAACTSQPNDVEPASDTNDGGISGYGEDGFQCTSPISPQSCCGVAGCATSWGLAASCATVAPAPYVLDSSACEGFLEARQGTTYLLFDATSGALVAILAGPGPQSDGFTCAQGPVALAVANDCLVHWQQASTSSPCTDAGSPVSIPDADCALDAPAE